MSVCCLDRSDVVIFADLCADKMCLYEKEYKVGGGGGGSMLVLSCHVYNNSVIFAIQMFFFSVIPVADKGSDVSAYSQLTG